MENEQIEQEPQQTQVITKVNSRTFNSEKFGSNDTIARDYSGKKLRDMYHLKQIEDILTLYDKVRPEDLKTHLSNLSDSTNSKLTLSRYRSVAVGLGVALYLLIKRQNPFVFQSYLNQIYTFPLLAFGIHHSVSMTYNFNLNGEEQNTRLSSILLTKSFIHSYSVKLTNRLRFDITDLV
jgi:hypothetical protein